MTQLVLEMKFSCCHCEASTTFVVHCQGAGLMAGDRISLSAEVPCFFCGCKHRVVFLPSGQVVDVEPVLSEERLMIPSVN
jgi:hypothetical protein